jgi:hypothetical protein
MLSRVLITPTVGNRSITPPFAFEAQASNFATAAHRAVMSFRDGDGRWLPDSTEYVVSVSPPLPVYAATQGSGGPRLNGCAKP